MSNELQEDAMRREAIKNSGAFKDPAKVNDMPAKQVTAIYLRLKAQGKVG